MIVTAYGAGDDHPAGEGTPTRRRDHRTREVLALHAGVLASMLGRDSLPPPWLGARFERDVGLIRDHLALLRSRALLVESFQRESAYLLATRHLSVADAERILATSAVDVAYAIRWLELTRRARAVPWAQWIVTQPLPIEADG